MWDAVLSISKLHRPVPGSLGSRIFRTPSNRVVLAKWLVMISAAMTPYNHAAVYSSTSVRLWAPIESEVCLWASEGEWVRLFMRSFWSCHLEL